ncbi:MAG: fasciclin domain-containing protein [Chitinophagaceae bacterium]
MKIFANKWMRTVAMITAAVSMLSSCNKDLPVAEPIVVNPSTGSTIFETIRANGNIYSYLDSAIARASTFNSPAGKLDVLLNDKKAVLTLFAPDNDAFQRSFQALGLPTGVSTLKGFRTGQLDSILRYHIIGGQKFASTGIPTTFPNNLYLQSTLILSPPSPTLPPGYRMPLFPGKQGTTNFINNIPLVQADIEAANGIMHRASFVVLPPSQVLWQRIASDPELTYLKAAVERADGNVPPGNPPGTLVSALSNPAANLTLLAPTDAAFQALLTGQITLALIPIVTQQLIPVITQQLIAGGATQAEADAAAPGLAAAQAPAIAQGQAAALASTPAVFTNPALAGVLTPQTVAGIVVYHLLAMQTGTTFQGIRAFSVNIPSTETSSFTLLNSAIAAHPGVILKATYGFAGVIAITAKGLGNATPSSVQINPTPAPGGSSDQHYINGVLHKIDQVLIPQ